MEYLRTSNSILILICLKVEVCSTTGRGRWGQKCHKLQYRFQVSNIRFSTSLNSFGILLFWCYFDSVRNCDIWGGGRSQTENKEKYTMPIISHVCGGHWNHFLYEFVPKLKIVVSGTRGSSSKKSGKTMDVKCRWIQFLHYFHSIFDYCGISGRMVKIKYNKRYNIESLECFWGHWIHFW